ncbi:uncharacterized protein L203_106356 [Cryptococcus depauperatus CBS 7841]|uniref:Uncharacterized protein n=1 Tax=Cryptococcus depauperatus CBS 7841 TaxID=1295531 RepID=A0A1E3IL14_9TREE|nr:hypothetical protein L203_02643 [Cryptococcus depauperatus CBS 7841]ODN88636.1 hypothetical protein L203_02646 [Cryptococcus depauperatus CBS 7841]
MDNRNWRSEDRSLSDPNYWEGYKSVLSGPSASDQQNSSGCVQVGPYHCCLRGSPPCAECQYRISNSRPAFARRLPTDIPDDSTGPPATSGGNASAAEQWRPSLAATETGFLEKHGVRLPCIYTEFTAGTAAESAAQDQGADGSNVSMCSGQGASGMNSWPADIYPPWQKKSSAQRTGDIYYDPKTDRFIDPSEPVGNTAGQDGRG